MGCGKLVAGGGVLIAMTPLRPCSSSPTPASLPSTWPITVCIRDSINVNSYFSFPFFFSPIMHFCGFGGLRTRVLFS